jgi:hypothetical protein
MNFDEENILRLGSVAGHQCIGFTVACYLPSNIKLNLTIYFLLSIVICRNPIVIWPCAFFPFRAVAAVLLNIGLAR